MKIGVTQIILGKFSLDEIVRLCKEAGYNIVELVFAEGKETDINSSPERLREIAGRFQEAGVAITSVLGRYADSGNLLSTDPAERDKAKRALFRTIEIAGTLGTGAMLLHPGQLTPNGTYQEAWDGLKAVLQEAAPLAAEHKVKIGLENVWNKFLLSPKEMREFLDEVGSPWVGCYLDTANMMAYGFTEHWVRELGSRIVRVHFKDFKRREHAFVPLLDGDTDWKTVMNELQAIGYNDGFIHEVSGDWELQVEMARRMRQIVSQIQ